MLSNEWTSPRGGGRGEIGNDEGGADLTDEVLHRLIIIIIKNNNQKSKKKKEKAKNKYTANSYNIYIFQVLVRFWKIFFFRRYFSVREEIGAGGGRGR